MYLYLHTLLLLPFSTAASEAESVASTCPESVASTCAESDNTAGIIGGVVAVAFMIITALTVIVIVVLVLRTFRGNLKTRYSREIIVCLCAL